MNTLVTGLVSACLFALASAASAVTIAPTAQTAVIEGNDQLNGNGPNVAPTQAALNDLLAPYFEPGFGAYQIGRFEVDAPNGGADAADITVTQTSDTTGSWEYTGQDTPYVVVYKAGNYWLGQYFAGGIFANMYDLANLNGATFNGGNNVPGLSHITLYGVDGNEDNTSPVPLPAAGFLLIASLGALGAMKRRKS